VSDAGRGPKPEKAHQGLLKVLRPSAEASEFVALLGWSVDWAGLNAALRQFKDYQRLGDINGDVKAALKNLGHLSPAAREDKRKELRSELIAQRRREWQSQRAQAWNLYELVKLYEKHRARIQSLAPDKRSGAVHELIAAYCNPDPDALAKLDASTAKHAAKRKARMKLEKSRRYMAMQLKYAGLQYGPRKPMQKMMFPKSAANPVRAAEQYYDTVCKDWEVARTAIPELESMAPKEAAAIVLPGSRLVRPDDGMWHSRKAPFIQSQAEHDVNHEDNEIRHWKREDENSN
jgi:hypothetical protein